MKNKIIILSLFSLLLSACKNPFVGMVSPDDARIADENSEELNDITNVKKSVVTFNSYLKSEDISITFSVEKNIVTVMVNEIFDLYEWHIGDVIFSKEQKCKIDFGSFVNGIYPVIVYTQREGKLYSAEINFTKNEDSIFAESFIGLPNENNANRTVFPSIKENELTDIKMEIIDEKEEVVGKGSWNNYSNFSKTKISIDFGEYNFKITAKHKNLSVNFEKKIEINSEEQIVDVYFTFTKLSGIDTGGIDISVCFKTDYSISDAIVSVYKNTNSGYKLYATDSVANGKLRFENGKNENAGFKYIQYKLDSMDYGIYWLRVDCIAANETKAGYYVDYIHVASGEISKINTSISSFFDLFTVTYNNNGGFYTGNSLMTKVSQFDNFVLPNDNEMIKPGYSFGGWFFDKEFVLPYSVNGIGTVNNDLFLYAKWNPNNQSEIIAGIGLLNESLISINEKTDGIDLKFMINIASDLICIDVYDNEGRILNSEYDYIEKGENNSYLVSLNFKARKSDIYMVEISSYKTVNTTDAYIYNEKVYTQKQIFKALYNH